MSQQILPEWNRSVRVELSADVVDVELEVGDVDEARVLMDVKHVRVQSRQVKNVLGESGQGQLKGEHLSEGPVVGRRLEGGRSPLLQHRSRNHRSLNLLQNFAQNL